MATCSDCDLFACNDCIFTCFRCTKVVCKTCNDLDINKCSVCANLVCTDCSNNCSCCDKAIVCKEH